MAKSKDETHRLGVVMPKSLYQKLQYIADFRHESLNKIIVHHLYQVVYKNADVIRVYEDNNKRVQELRDAERDSEPKSKSTVTKTKTSKTPPKV